MQDQKPSAFTRKDFFLHMRKKQQRVARDNPLAHFALRKMHGLANFLDPRGLQELDSQNLSRDESLRKYKNKDSSL